MPVHHVDGGVALRNRRIRETMISQDLLDRKAVVRGLFISTLRNVFLYELLGRNRWSWNLFQGHRASHNKKIRLANYKSIELITSNTITKEFLFKVTTK